MKPSEVRERILKEHESLRALARNVENLADRAVTRDGAQELLKRIDEFWFALNRHIDGEEMALAPILQSIDAWGPVRLERMKSMHVEQRAALGAIHRAITETRIMSEVYEQARRLIAVVLFDMADEEGDLLHPDLLRDDIIAIESIGA
jgi:hemerythrin-like domain-containing protein